MRIAHISDYNLTDRLPYSGSSFWISKSLEQAGIRIDNFGLTPAQKCLPPLREFIFRLRQSWVYLTKSGYLDPNWNIEHAYHIAAQFRQILINQQPYVVLTTLSPLCGAFLDISLPIIHWTDAPYAALSCFYPFFRNHHVDTAWDAHFLTQQAYSKAKLLIFSSEWAARSAIEFYGIEKEKVKVVPFGANLDITHNESDVRAWIAARSKKIIKLLFVGLNWNRKRGDFAMSVARMLHESGYEVELTCVGGMPDSTKDLPFYVKLEDRLYKNNKHHVERLKQLYQETHFLLVPSVAECCAVSFAEACAFGVPCLTTYVGGNAEAVKDNINGMTFSLEATVEDYCNFITTLIHTPEHYKALALSAFNEYQTRLNWRVAGQSVKSHIFEMLENEQRTLSPRKFFNMIYDQQIWNNQDESLPLSGPGSASQATQEIQKYLKDLIQNFQFFNLLDIGCGDLNWLPDVIVPSFNYTGMDVCDELILSHRAKFPHWRFKIGDALTDPLPSADLILIKDVIIHLTNQQIIKLLCNLAKTKFTYVLFAMTLEKRKFNFIAHPWFFSEVNLLEEPFSFVHITQQVILDNKLYILMSKNQLIDNLLLPTMRDKLFIPIKGKMNAYIGPLIKTFSSSSSSSLIPKKIHMVWLGKNRLDFVDKNLHSWMKYHPNWDVRLWTDCDLTERNFAPEVLSKINEANVPAQKADILRAFIVRDHGGVYVDADMICYQSLECLFLMLNSTFYGCHEESTYEEGYLSTGFFASIPHHPLLINFCKKLLTAQLNTQDIHKQTGPGCFGNCITPLMEIVLLPTSFFYPTHYTNPHCKFDPSESYANHEWRKSWA